MMGNNDPDKTALPDSDLTVKAEEYLEVITTEDERIKIIGEELANDTGRAIFGKISQGIASPNDLAKSLNISLPLINWHINRLLNVGLVKVEKTELSSKNKQVKYYGPVKTALVIIPPEKPVDVENNSKATKETVLLKLRQYLASFVALAASIPTIYSIQKSLDNTNKAVLQPPQAEDTSMMMKSTESFRAAEPLMAPASVPEPSAFANEPQMIMIAFLGGAAIALCVFFITKLYLRRKKKNLLGKH